MKKKTLISAGDFIDLFYKVRQSGLSGFASVFHLSDKSRTASKWNNAESTSDFWIIPEVRKRWNLKCAGNDDTEYEDYFVQKYLSGKEGLRMLSVGCGSGARERKFARYPQFSLIEGIDIAEKLTEEARQTASEQNLDNIRYITGDFVKARFEPSSYDVVLFNSSLHHFINISGLIKNKVIPLLRTGGFLVLFDYTGPNRLQWTISQLKASNELLQALPEKYRKRFRSNSCKQKIYRPGIFRMIIVDPSEAPDSESIITSIHENFDTLEEKEIGWNITHLLFKDIAHNFLHGDNETQELLSYIFEKEDEYMEKAENSDAVFGIYRKRGKTA